MNFSSCLQFECQFTYNHTTFHTIVTQVCCHQYLFQDGVFKLNDFNYAKPIYKDTNNEQCTRSSSSFHMKIYKIRSFEELTGTISDKEIQVKPDKIDVWMMGNVIYLILTDLYVFEKPKFLGWEESAEELLAGRRSQIPEHIAKSKDPAHEAVKTALEMCWTQDWKKRPSARSISDYLMNQLRNITGEENPDVRVNLPERDPKQRSTESDYEKNNDWGTKKKKKISNWVSFYFCRAFKSLYLQQALIAWEDPTYLKIYTIHTYRSFSNFSVVWSLSFLSTMHTYPKLREPRKVQ